MRDDEQFLYMPHDFYPTPPGATRALLTVETFRGAIWEPACGDGAIAKVLAHAGYSVVATDLVDHGFGTAGVDFLEQSATRAPNIITNPPYRFGMADAFVRKALDLTANTGGSVAMLLNMSSLAHPRRHHLWVARPPAAIYALDDVVFARTDTAHRYVWCVWKAGHTGRPSFWWLSVR